jgi:HEAT repeat protein
MMKASLVMSSNWSVVRRLWIVDCGRWTQLLCLAACLAFAPEAFCGGSTSTADIGRVLGEAAKYQPGESREAFRRIEEMVAQSVTNASTRSALEDGLVRLLESSSTFEARRFACKQLGIIGSKEALPALAALLKSDETAGIACLALSTYPRGKADDILREAEGTASKGARVQIMNTLGDRRDSDSVKLLEELAGGADSVVAGAAISALGRIGDKAAWKAISNLRQSAAPALRPAVTEAAVRCAASLAAVGDHKPAIAAYEELLVPSQPVYIRRAALDGLLRLDKDQGEQRIAQVLHGPDSALKPVAVAAVRSLRSKQASARFAAELPHLQPEEQVWMIDSLAARNDAVAREAIAKSVSASGTGVRRAAITALGRVGDVSSVPVLSRAIAASTEPEEQRALETALISLNGGTPVDNAILRELTNSSSNTRVSLIAVLARRQGPAANPVLLQETGNSDPAVASAAFRALGRTSLGTDVPALLRKLVEVRDPSVRAEAQSAAGQALVKLNDAGSRSAAVLDALRRTQNPDSISALLSLLPVCGDAQALTVLKAGQRDPDAQVRDTAVRALAEWPDAAVWDTLADIYRQGASEGLRGLALRGLVRIAGEENAHPDAKLIERYRELLAAARGDSDLRLILGTLAGAAHPDALQLALPLCQNAAVHAEAEVAVKKIADSIKAQHPLAAQQALEQIQAKR